MVISANGWQLKRFLLYVCGGLGMVGYVCVEEGLLGSGNAWGEDVGFVAPCSSLSPCPLRLQKAGVWCARLPRKGLIVVPLA